MTERSYVTLLRQMAETSPQPDGPPSNERADTVLPDPGPAVVPAPRAEVTAPAGDVPAASDDAPGASANPWATRAGLDPAGRERLARVQRLAKLLDSQFRVPGTSRTFGVDAVLGLVPGIGGSAGLVLSVGLIVQAIHAGARPATVARMMGIAGVDALIGTIPVLGTVFDFVFKANERNTRVLASQALQPDRTTKDSQRLVATTVLGAIALVLLVLVVAVVGVVLLLRAVF